MRQKIASYALALPLLMAAMQAGAVTSPILSLSNATYGSSGVGAISTTTGSVITGAGNDYWVTPTTTVTSTTSVVQTAPTTTSAGLAYDYNVYTSTYTSHTVTWNTDSVALSIAADGTVFGPDKTATIAGTLTSAVDTTVAVYVYANGNYQSSTSPFGGASTPALPTLYIGGTMATLTPVNDQSTYTTAAAQTYSTQNNSYYLTLTAGQTVSFVAGVYAPTQASLSNFIVSLSSDLYNYHDVADLHTSSTQVLTGAHIIPAVPEPEPFMMVLAGLGAIVMRSRRRAPNEKLG